MSSFISDNVCVVVHGPEYRRAAVSIKHGLQTADSGLGIKHGLGHKTRTVDEMRPSDCSPYFILTYRN